MEISKKIQEARKNAKLSQEELAHLIGVDRSTISKWERGINKISNEDLNRIVEVLNLNENYFENTNENYEDSILSENKDKQDNIKTMNKNHHKIILIVAGILCLPIILFLSATHSGLTVNNNDQSSIDEGAEETQKDIYEEDWKENEIFEEYVLRIESYFYDDPGMVNIELNGIITKQVINDNSLSFYAVSNDLTRHYICDNLTYDGLTGRVHGSINVPIIDNLIYYLTVNNERYILHKGDKNIYNLETCFEPNIKIDEPEFEVVNHELFVKIYIKVISNSIYSLRLSKDILYTDIYKDNKIIDKLEEPVYIEEKSITDESDDLTEEYYCFTYSIKDINSKSSYSFHPGIKLKGRNYMEIEGKEKVEIYSDSDINHVKYEIKTNENE